jgi:UDP-N-acetylglucosamine 4-epimerase
MTAYEQAKSGLRSRPKRWLVTGVAGFIGSNLLETLLGLGQEVVGLDNFSTGFRRNLDLVRAAVGDDAWSRFEFIEGDICRPEDCRTACERIDFVLHQAALGSVPRSIANPQATHEANVDGFLNMLIAARDATVARFVYASSSSVYGDHPALPKVEDRVGRPLSPYAATKAMNEMYAEVFARSYGIETIGLRYFNVFGPRQDPHGAYAAVIPRWIAALIDGRKVQIYGDGQTTRDFCYVDNAVQANVLAATAQDPAAVNRAYNVAVGDRMSLTDLFEACRDMLGERFDTVREAVPDYGDFRAGDVRHSQADIGMAKSLLGYAPTLRVREGLRAALDWYVSNLPATPLGAHV